MDIEPQPAHSGQEQSPAGVPMITHEDAHWPGRSVLHTQSPPLFSAPPAASPPLLQRPASNPMQLTSSTSPSLFDVGAAVAASSSSASTLAPAETAIVHSFLAFSPSPPTPASESAAASHADENMATMTLQQSQAHPQQPQIPQPQSQPQQPPAAQALPQQQTADLSAPAPFLIPLFSPSPTLDGHALSLRPSFDLHSNLFSPPLQHAQHHLQQSQTSHSLALLDVSSPPPPPVPRNSPSLAAATVASPASSSLASGSPRLHHPRPLQHSPLQRYAAELEVAEFVHAQNQLQEKLAMEIETIQRRRHMRETMMPHMELAPPANAAAAASSYHPRTAHIAAHCPIAAVAAHTIARQSPLGPEYTLAIPVAQRLHQQQPQQYAQQRPVLAALAMPVERAVRVDAQHLPQHSQHSMHSTSLPRNRRVMAPIMHAPLQPILAQEIPSPSSSSSAGFRLSTTSAGSTGHHAPALSTMPHVPWATRAAPMARVTPRSIVSPQRSPAPSMQYTRAAAAAATATPAASSTTASHVVMMEDTRPPDSSGSNSVASLGSVAAASERRSMSRALSPLARDFASSPMLPSMPSSSSAAAAGSAASVAGSVSPDLVMTRYPRAAAASKRKHCDWPGCTSHFAKLSALIRHRRVHTKEKPFMCEHEGCSAAFSEKGNLVRHEEEMHADHRNFACPFSNYCQQRFRRAAHLEQHLAARHAAMGEDIARPWMFHAAPEEPLQTNVKRKWRAAAGAKKEAITSNAADLASATTAAFGHAASPSSSEPLQLRSTAPLLPFSFASSSAASATPHSDLFLLPPSAVRGSAPSSSSSSSDLRFVINTAAVEAAAAAAAAGASSAPIAATMPLQRVRVQAFTTSKIKTELGAAAAAALAAPVAAGSKRRLAALSPPRPLMSDSSTSSESSMPLLAAMDALHLPPSAIDGAADNAAPRPRSPRPKRTRRAPQLPLSLQQLDSKFTNKPS